MVCSTLWEAYQGALASYRKSGGGALQRTTQVSRLNPLRAFCKWLARNRVIESDPSRELQLPKLPRRLPPRIPSVEEMSRILSAADGPRPGAIRDRAMMETLYSTALRRMELVRLRVCDVSLESSTLYVRSGKGGRDRVLPVGYQAGVWIGRYLREVRPRLASGVDRGELFLIESGADIRFIQALLGHSSLSTTQVYTHVTIAKLREIHKATHPTARRPRAGAILRAGPPIE